MSLTFGFDSELSVNSSQNTMRVFWTSKGCASVGTSQRLQLPAEERLGPITQQFHMSRPDDLLIA